MGRITRQNRTTRRTAGDAAGWREAAYRPGWREAVS
eukprot:COSAG04_NODE_20737_length_387_cov_1.076389_1_plen_35_part_01